MGSYLDLDIYHDAHSLAVKLHRFTLKLPKHELYETGSQLRRSSKAVSANIVEGYGRRRYKSDYIRFLIFAHSSCDETIEWVNYIRDCHDELKSEAEEFLKLLDLLGKRINRYIRAIESQHQT